MPLRVVISAFGPPAEVASVKDFPSQPLQPGQVRVRMDFATINPADLNFAEGVYGIRPTLPSCIGNEGTGKITESAADVGLLPVGTQIIPLAGLQTWAEEIVINATELFALPSGVPLPQAAQLRVNPLTAWALLRDFETLHPGDWVVQNAGNSAVGLAVSQLASARGISVLSFVRSDTAAETCRHHSDQPTIVETSANALEEAKAILGDERAKLALNAVGGESALRLANLLADRGHHVTYGAMGRQKLSIPNRFLIFQEHQFVGFWLTRWLGRTPQTIVHQAYQELAVAMASGHLKLPVAKVYDLNELPQALKHAAEGQRGGKILLRL